MKAMASSKLVIFLAQPSTLVIIALAMSATEWGAGTLSLPTWAFVAICGCLLRIGQWLAGPFEKMAGVVSEEPKGK